MNYFVFPAVVAALLVLATPQAHAQSDAQLASVAAACATSGDACTAAIISLRASIAALPPAQRQLAVANLAAALRAQAAVAPPAVQAALRANVAGALVALSQTPGLAATQVTAITQVAQAIAAGTDGFGTDVDVTGSSPA